LPRVRRDDSGRVAAIVAAGAGAGAAAAEADAGVYCFAGAALKKALAGSRDGGAAESVGLLASRGGKVEAVEAEDWREAWRIQTRQDLAGAEEIARRRAVERALDAGATVVDPGTTRI